MAGEYQIEAARAIHVPRKLRQAGCWQRLPRPELSLAASGCRLEVLFQCGPLFANQLVQGLMGQSAGQARDGNIVVIGRL